MTLWKEPGSWVERFESTLTAATNAARRLYANPPPPDAGPNWLPDADGPGAECRRAACGNNASSFRIAIRSMWLPGEIRWFLLALMRVPLRGWGAMRAGCVTRTSSVSGPACEWWQHRDALHVMAGREMNARIGDGSPTR